MKCCPVPWDRAVSTAGAGGTAAPGEGVGQLQLRRGYGAVSVGLEWGYNGATEGLQWSYTLVTQCGYTLVTV